MSIEPIQYWRVASQCYMKKKRTILHFVAQLILPYQHHVSKSCQLQLLQQLSGLRYRISFFEKKSFETVQTVALIGNNKNKIFILTSVSAILLLLLFLGPNATAFKTSKISEFVTQFLDNQISCYTLLVCRFSNSYYLRFVSQLALQGNAFIYFLCYKVLNYPVCLKFEAYHPREQKHLNFSNHQDQTLLLPNKQVRALDPQC